MLQLSARSDAVKNVNLLEKKENSPRFQVINYDFHLVDIPNGGQTYAALLLLVPCCMYNDLLKGPMKTYHPQRLSPLGDQFHQ